MIKVPLKLDGRPVNNMQNLKRHLADNGRLNFPELYNQWSSLMQFLDQDGQDMGAETLPPLLNCRYQYLHHILHTDPENFKVIKLRDDIFSMDNQTGYKTANQEQLANLFSEIKKTEKIQSALKETDSEYLYWICGQNKKAIFQDVEKSDIADNKKLWFFYILTALYCRIGILYKDYPADMKVMELFFNEESGKTHFAEQIKEAMSGDTEKIEIIPLGKGKNYILFASGKPEAYEKGGIRCKCLYRKEAKTADPVTICFCEDGNEKEELGRILLQEGQSRKVLVNREGVILRVLPYMSTNREDFLVSSLKGAMKMKLYHGPMDKNVLEKRPDKEWSEDQCRGITSFAADGKGGFLAVCNGKILTDYVMEDMIYYDPQLEYAVDCGMEVAEVWIEKGYYYFLKTDGSVFGNNPEYETNSNGRKVLDEEMGGIF